MQILYKNETAKKQFCSEYKKKWRYPEQVKKKLVSAENYILNAESLRDVANYPPFHFEHLIQFCCYLFFETILVYIPKPFFQVHYS